MTLPLVSLIIHHMQAHPRVPRYAQRTHEEMPPRQLVQGGGVYVYSPAPLPPPPWAWLAAAVHPADWQDLFTEVHRGHLHLYGYARVEGDDERDARGQSIQIQFTSLGPRIFASEGVERGWILLRAGPIIEGRISFLSDLETVHMRALACHEGHDECLKDVDMSRQCLASRLKVKMFPGFDLATGARLP